MVAVSALVRITGRSHKLVLVSVVVLPLALSAGKVSVKLLECLTQGGKTFFSSMGRRCVQTRAIYSVYPCTEYDRIAS